MDDRSSVGPKEVVSAKTLSIKKLRTIRSTVMSLEPDEKLLSQFSISTGQRSSKQQKLSINYDTIKR